MLCRFADGYVKGTACLGHALQLEEIGLLLGWVAEPTSGKITKSMRYGTGAGGTPKLD